MKEEEEKTKARKCKRTKCKKFKAILYVYRAWKSIANIWTYKSAC